MYKQRTFLIAALMGVAIFVGVWGIRRFTHVPPHHQPSPPPPPLVAVHPPDRVNIILAVTPSPDTVWSDSVAAILQRDFEESDWLHVVPSDSIAQAAATVQVTLASSALSVTLIAERPKRLYRSETFPVPATRQQASVNDSVARAAIEGRRWAVHGVADALVQWITGETGIAQSRIAYVAHGAIHIVDQDGVDDRAYPNVGIALSPAWSHDGSRLVYSTLTSSGTTLMELDLRRGSETRLAATSGGLNITPVYSPDDRWIVYAHGDESGTTLMALRRDSAGAPKTIIPGRGFDNSSPVFSPDGKRIAFVSARPKTPQIYSVNINGTGEKIETPPPPTGRSYRASPDWSPDGRTIAFEQQNGDFQLWLLTLADHHMHRITSSGDNEDPTWAPDSRHLAFTAVHHGEKDIWTLDTATGRLRQITHDGDARLAAWSPTFIKN